MSSENQFAASHTGFWKAIMPMGDAYLRALNMRAGSFGREMAFSEAPERRALVNESGFVIFSEAVSSNKEPGELPADAIGESVRRSAVLISSLGRPGLIPTAAPRWLESYEMMQIAQRLRFYFRDFERNLALQIRPRFPGCGWVDEAEGDVLAGETLYEVKAGARQFRLIDVRQLLVYCALNTASNAYSITRVALLNPRSGAYLKTDLDLLCREVSGASAAELLGEIVNYVSEPFSRYVTG